MLAPRASNTTKNPINLCPDYLIPVPNLVAKLPGVMSKVEVQLTGFARFLQGVVPNP